MATLEKIVSHFVFFLLCLLTFLLIFEAQVSIPFWLQPLGRMHPLMLHFPIVLIVLLVLLDVFRSHLEPASFEKIRKALLGFTAVTTSAAAIMGFFLSLEEDSASSLMDLHKWIGVSVSYLVYLLLLIDKKILWYRVTLYASFVTLFFAGHFGAGLTHGTDFLTEPIARAQKKKITEATPIFEAFVDPILEAKCKACHNAQKHKGALDMSTFELMSKGGENGPIWVKGNTGESELIIRALLPLEHEDHMPPEGKSQLSAPELTLLKSWIGAGADPKVSLKQLNPTDSLFMLANQRMKAMEEESPKARYDFDFASEALVSSLNNPYRTVTQETPLSPALDVNIYVKTAYKPEYLTELKKVKDQIVSLNLAYMPIKDEDMNTIANFSNLEDLKLNHTEISNAALTYLKNCTRLESLSLSGTAIDIGISENLGALPAIKDVYLWNTGIDDNQLADLKNQWPDIRFYHGYSANQESPIRLTAPLLKNKNKILAQGEKVVLEHKMPGVSIRYTTDGSDPDSISSALYESPIEVQSFTSVKTIAYKEGWLTSEARVYEFFVEGQPPVTAELINSPHTKYKGKGAISLIDLEKGNATGFNSKSWLGYQDKPLAAWVDFGENPPTLQQLVLSYGMNMGQYIMPPIQVEVWGGNDRRNIKLLKRIVPNQPAEYQPDGVMGIAMAMPVSDFRYYQVKAFPMKKLPAWHSGKGEPGWVFVDELFFY